MKNHDATLLLSTPWIWLMFSLYYFVPFVTINGDAATYTFLVVAYACFVASYQWAMKLNSRHMWKPLSIMAIIFLVVTPISPGSNALFPFIGFFLGLCYAPRTYLVLLCSGLTAIVCFQLYYNYPISAFLLPSITGLVAASLWGYVKRIRSSARRDLLQSHQEIQQLAIIAERERIARDLHDILGHTLSSIVLKTELAEKLLQQNKTNDAALQVSELHQIARDSLALVRQTVSGYKHRGLSGEVIQLCEKLRFNGFTVEVIGDIPTLSARNETALILALTELTTNILRHSTGNHCKLSFRTEDRYIMVSMQDNGSTQTITRGNGLNGIEERLHALAGTICAYARDGCRIDICLPTYDLTQVKPS